ncbi:CGH_1_collapsed_G0027710.mRNA.1.CDS.1 [Saccharomyces cerevisiae]|nr:CGH_1_collapsed_G0027710.mRNA.1.CDS.1 [Saccharomyces cerevisiae]
MLLKNLQKTEELNAEDEAEKEKENVETMEELPADGKTDGTTNAVDAALGNTNEKDDKNNFW